MSVQFPHPTRLPRARAAQAAVSLAAIGAWLAVLISQAPRLTAFGPICGEARGLGLLAHCPLCYVALSLTLLAVLTLGAARDRPAAALARSRP